MNFKKLSFKTGIFAFAALALTQLGMHETGTEHILVRLQLQQYPAQMRQIQALDYDVAGINFKNKTVDLVVTSAEVTQLKKLGFHTLSARSLVSKASPDQQYHTASEVADTLKAYEKAYPDLAQVFTVGKSLEGRDIMAIKITSHVKKSDPSKPHILFNGMHHAREVMSTEVPLDTIDFLLTRYGKDSKATHWVDANEIWVLPMFNVDGNNQVWTKDTMWRKNTRGGFGVDINRNYPYAWNSCRGSSSNERAQDYHGTSAGSEPETQVMMDFVKKIRPVFSISYHSYSEIVIYPYGCEGSHVPTREVVESIGVEMAGKIVTDDGGGHYKAGTAPELLYSVDGGDIDWMYHEYQVIPFVIEVNS
ncbi:MAG: zinc carboxypeptidase, partial [Bdellovibrionales bacterium]|nr:zinc carboxypeptidase [Oligoflexia bacterium]